MSFQTSMTEKSTIKVSVNTPHARHSTNLSRFSIIIVPSNELLTVEIINGVFTLKRQTQLSVTQTQNIFKRSSQTSLLAIIGCRHMFFTCHLHKVEHF